MSTIPFDLASSTLGIPKMIAYGTVRGRGNLVFQEQQSDNSTVSFYLLGEGSWGGPTHIWVNGNLVSLGAQAHFHKGGDGVIGSGMAPTSAGTDQGVDSFWALPAGFDVVTFSRFAYMALHIAPDPTVLASSLDLIADYQALEVRQFDSSGNQTAFAWTDNPAWWILDFLLRKFILREAKINQPLTALESARIDFASFKASADYFDVNIGGGIKRFSDGGVWFTDQGLTADTALQKMLLMCRSYLLERSGKLYLYADFPRASVFTFTSDNVQEDSLQVAKTTSSGAQNRILASWREMALASGSSDDETRMSQGSSVFDHEANQYAIGTRGPGLSTIPKRLELQLDFGVNTGERVARLSEFQLLRQLGDNVDTNSVYLAPAQVQLVAFDPAPGFVAIKPGDVVTLHSSLSEEYSALQFEVMDMEVRPDGTRAFSGLEYIADAFTDTADTPQTVKAPDPGDGLPPPFEISGSGDLVVPIDTGVADGVNYYRPPLGVQLPTDLPYNPSFEIFPDGQSIAEGWTPNWSTPAGQLSRSVAPYAGAYAQNIGNLAGSPEDIASRPFAVKAGAVYTLAARVKASSANVGNLYIGVLFFADDSDFSVAGWLFQGGMLSYMVAANTANPATYTLWAGSIVIPAGVQFARIQLLNHKDLAHGGLGTAGVLTFDTVTWRLSQVSNADQASPITVGPTTSSTTPSPVPDMSLTKEFYGGKVLILFSGSFNIFSGPGTASLQVYRDGSPVSPATLFTAPNTLPSYFPLSAAFIDSPSAGSHTYEIWWAAGVSSISLGEQDSRQMQVQEIA